MRGWILTAAVLVLGCSASSGDVADPGTGTGASSGNGGVGGGSSGSGGGGGGISIGGGGGTGGVATGGTGATATGGTGGNACTPPLDTPTTEACGNGLDDDLDGFVDEGCSCPIGTQQPCFGGTPSQANLPNCVKGTQTCSASGEFGQWGPCQAWNCGPATPPPEICDNGVDEDCDGVVDDGCSLSVPVNIDGDCLSAFCPPQAPFPIGCNIIMDGGDSRGCVANTPGQSGVYFKEGDACPNPLCPFCDAGHISGTLLCSSQPALQPLNETNCPINKSQKFYPTDPSGCP